MPQISVIPHRVLLEAWQFTGTVADLKAMIKWAKDRDGRVTHDKEENIVVLEMENYDLIINETDWLIHTPEGLVKMTMAEKIHNYVNV